MPKPGDPVKKPAAGKGLEVKYATSIRACQLVNVERFADDFRFLSNFWPAKVVMDGATYPTVEHAYQAAKTTDERDRLKIRLADSPGVAKKLGKLVSLRPHWDSINILVMNALLRQKFAPGSKLAKKLLETGDARLVYWGVCKGVGENHLGELLMMIREALKNPCTACKGKGKNSKGGDCYPCAGTGVQGARNAKP
jgi:ribA/ribD-fused uncharacterized protein